MTERQNTHPVNALWTSRDVELGDYWERDGRVYRTIGLITDPVIVIQPVEVLACEKTEHHVICSPNFAEFKRLRPERPS